MAIWTSIKDKAALSRVEDEAIHAAAMNEINSGRRRDGLWTKAIIECGGNETAAKIAYLKLLVVAIKDDVYLARRAEELRPTPEPKAQQRNSSSNRTTTAQTFKALPRRVEPPANASQAELMVFYRIEQDGGQFTLGTYRFSEFKHALAHARHLEELKR